MEEIRFKSGRKLYIRNNCDAGYILMECRNDADDETKAKTLLRTYVESAYQDPKFDCLNAFVDKVFKNKMKEEDYELLENNFFEAVEKYGENYMIKYMSNFKMVIFFVSNGLSVPGGALSWD